MIPSRRQQAVYSAWNTTDSNLVIEAVAGSGKTTTLLQLLRRCEHRTLFLAFNKSIQEEIQATIESMGLGQGKAMTMHAVGLSAIRKHTKFTIDGRKNMEMIKKLQDNNRRQFNNLTWEKKVRLSFTLMDFNDISRIFLTDHMEAIIEYMKGMDKSYYEVDWLEDLWEQMLELREEYHNEERLKIDFHDMIFIPLQKNLEIPIYPAYLMIDEAQDLNLAQHALVEKLIGQGTIKRWIAVGDSHQSIYGFAGSYASSFQKFKEKDNTIELPLDICYRCPTEVLDSANEIYDIMQGHKEEPGVVQTIIDSSMIKSGSLVICRNTSPLIDLYFELLGQGRKVFLKGEDIIPTVKKFLKPYMYGTVRNAMLKLREQLVDLEHNKNDSDNDRMRYYWFRQQFDNIESITSNLSPHGGMVKELFTTLDEVSKEEGPDAITLCTIHKAKGLESDVVYILNEHLIPSKFAISQQQLKQEKNLKYVARTRAKKELYFLNL